MKEMSGEEGERLLGCHYCEVESGGMRVLTSREGIKTSSRKPAHLLRTSPANVSEADRRALAGGSGRRGVAVAESLRGDNITVLNGVADEQEGGSRSTGG